MTTTIQSLQLYLLNHGFNPGKVDGVYGDQTKQALLNCLMAGPDTPMTPDNIARGASLLNVTPAHIRTVKDVEASGAGFANGLPKILFEGHIFSKLTGHRYDASHPRISYPHWDRSKYPATQVDRYRQLLEAVGLDPDAAFSAASYGCFQIMGENYRACGYNSAFEFVLAQCQSEGDQLLAFVNFLKTNHLDAALRNNDWARFAEGYNGSGYRANAYDTKLANAFAAESAKG